MLVLKKHVCVLRGSVSGIERVVSLGLRPGAKLCSGFSAIDAVIPPTAERIPRLGAKTHRDDTEDRAGIPLEHFLPE